MLRFVALLRGINVGGKNKIGMAELKERLEEEGFEGVATHSLAGNVILRSALAAKALDTPLRLRPADYRFSLNPASARTWLQAPSFGALV